MDCNAVWQWMRLHPWQSIVGGIFLVTAIGGAVMWFYSVAEARYKKRERERRDAIERIKNRILALAANTNADFYSTESARKRWIELLEGENEELVTSALRELQGAKEGWHP